MSGGILCFLKDKVALLCEQVFPTCTTTTQCTFPKTREPLNAPDVTRGTIWSAWNGQTGTVNGDNTARDDQFCDFSATFCDGAVIDTVTFKGRAQATSGPSQPDFFVQFFDNGVLTPVTFITNDGMQAGGSAGQIQQDGSAQNYAEFEVQLTGITTLAQLATLCVGFGFDGDVNTDVSGFEMLVTVTGCAPVALSDMLCSNVPGQLKDALQRDRDNQRLFITEDGDIGITGGNVIGVGLGNHPTPNVTTRVIHSQEYFARSANSTTQTAARNMTIVRTAVGRWTVTLASAHPNGVNFHPTITAEEQAGFRDTPDITVVQGTQNNSTTFDIQITTGDNGGAADGYVDTPFSIGIHAPVTVVTGVTH